jgi:hypothetical protein
MARNTNKKEVKAILDCWIEGSLAGKYMSTLPDATRMKIGSKLLAVVTDLRALDWDESIEGSAAAWLKKVLARVDNNEDCGAFDQPPDWYVYGSLCEAVVEVLGAPAETKAVQS